MHFARPFQRHFQIFHKMLQSKYIRCSIGNKNLGNRGMSQKKGGDQIFGNYDAAMTRDLTSQKILETISGSGRGWGGESTENRYGRAEGAKLTFTQ